MTYTGYIPNRNVGTTLAYSVSVEKTLNFQRYIEAIIKHLNVATMYFTVWESKTELNM